MDVLALLQLIAGPMGALILLAVLLGAIGYGGWKVLNDHLLPGIKTWMAKQDERFEKIMDSHEKDRAAFREAVTIIDGRLEEVEQDVSEIKHAINNAAQIKQLQTELSVMKEEASHAGS